MLQLAAPFVLIICRGWMQAVTDKELDFLLERCSSLRYLKLEGCKYVISAA